MPQCMRRPRVTYNSESSVVQCFTLHSLFLFQLTLLRRTLENAVSASMTWCQVIHDALFFSNLLLRSKLKVKKLSGSLAFVSTIYSMCRELCYYTLSTLVLLLQMCQEVVQSQSNMS